MKILFVNDIPFNPSYGGIEQVTDKIARTLLERGHQVFYLCGKVHKRDTILDYQYPTKLFVLPYDDFFKSKENIRYYNLLIKEQCIDIVINQRGLDCWQNEVLLSNYEVKKVSVLHSTPNRDLLFCTNLILTAPKSSLDYVKYTLKKILYPILRYRIRRRVSMSISKQYSFICRNSDAVVLLSNNDKKDFLSYLHNCHPKLLKGIPNPNSYPRQQLDLHLKEKMILYVGRLSSNDKCPLLLLKMWKSLYPKFHDWQLVFIGDGADRVVMEDYIYKNKIERAYLLGQKNEVSKYYKKASIVCLTSIFEGWGMALTEGMQFGCIPLTFNNYGAASDIIDDGINGFLIPAYNKKKYTMYLAELMQNDSKRERMAMAAYSKSMNFDIENIVDQWEELFSIIK